MRILNLYAGLGGNSHLWDGDVTSVELEPKIAKINKDNHPNHNVIVYDAHKYLKENYKNYDFVWSSPPCQKHTKMMKFTRHDVADYPDMNLYAEIIFLTHFFKGKWVVENVEPYYEPLIRPTAILGRHYFWSNFPISDIENPSPPNLIGMNTLAGVEKLKEWFGIKYEGSIYYGKNHSPTQILRNCVHPKVGLHILNCAIESLNPPVPLTLF